MRKLNLSLISTALAASMMFAPLADAARFGGGKSSGMTRSYSPPATRTYTAPAPRPYVAPAPRPVYREPARTYSPPQQKSGPGWGGVAAGAAAGAAAGYMLGNHNDHSVASSQMIAPAPGQVMQQRAPQQMPQDMTQDQPMAPVQNSVGYAPYPVQQAAPSSSFPWGLILVLAFATGGYLLYRRKREAMANEMGSYKSSASPIQSNARLFDANPAIQSSPVFNQRLPDGTEPAAFLRQAKASFMHLQTMNSPDNIDELRKYLTSEMFEQVKSEVAANKDIAEFPVLNADIEDTATENGQYVASVRFHGTVSESTNAPAESFTEVWHFVKAMNDASAKWMVAGIQQS